MKKYLFLFITALASLTFVACSNDDDNEDQPQSIVGEWSGCRPDDVQHVDKFIHYKFRKDGTFVIMLEAWAQLRAGKYTVSGNEITMDVEKIEWLWDRNNGYSGALEESGYESFEAWKQGSPEDWHMKATYRFDKDGNLYIENSSFGLQLVFFSDPNYQPQVHLW